MSRSLLRNLLVVVAAWSAIYLPGLGSLEIKGEEGRRILPAVTMLQTGNYLVPQVGSDPYFNKPPLINWLVAGSFKIFGKRDEWAARLPSALCILVVALAFITVARGALGSDGALIGALVWMTSFGMIEKGRLIEIEALYVSLCGLAIVCWLSWWQTRRSAWLIWIVPWIFLGLGMLAKGPVHLVFFYAVVIAVLWRTNELRAFWNWQHLLGVLLMLGIFAAWAIPCLQAMQNSNDVAHTWSRQFSGRLTGEDFKLSGWLLNIPRGLGYFLPWVLCLPLLKRVPNERAPAWGIGISFVVISLLPGSLARYTMPLLVPAAWLVAILLREKLRLVLVVAGIACIAMLAYGFAATPFLQRREKVRNIAAQINQAAALPNEPLYAVDPDYQPFLFYVRDPIVYLDNVSQVPVTARYVLVQPGKEAQALSSAQWLPRKAQPLLRLKDYRNKEVTLLEIGPTR